MINVIWNVVESFIEDWRNSPYEWATEIDIQAEIASRLRQALKDRGELYLEKLKYDYIRNKKPQNWSRVCCEWKTYYNDSQGSRLYCSPDIIVFDKKYDPNNPPDGVPRSLINFPMLWVCEIKYHTEDKSTFKEEREWDIKKLKILLDQDQTKYACGLYFDRTKIDSKPINPKKEKNDRFKNYIIKPKR